jgi:hypothetical protein
VSDPSLLVARTENVANVGGVASAVLAEFALGSPEVDLFGPNDDQANAAPPAIYWIPLHEEWTASQNRGGVGSPGSLFERWVPVSFLIFGGLDPNATWTDAESIFHDCDMTERYLSRLVNALHRKVSGKSYKFVSFAWTSAGRTGIGMPGELVVAFRLPLVREDNPTIDGIVGKTFPEFYKEGVVSGGLSTSLGVDVDDGGSANNPADTPTLSGGNANG